MTETATAQPELDVDGTAEEIHPEPAPFSSAAAQTLTLANPPARTTALVAGESAAERIKVAREIATQLDDIIKEQGLRTKIGRKKITRKNGQSEWVDNFHIDIDAWQTLAAFLELAAVPVWTRRVIDPATGDPERVRYTVKRFFYPKGTKAEQIKDGTADVERVETAEVDGYSWEARVEVYKDGALVAAGESMVSRTEESWRDSDDHAVRAMAQTRASSRAIASVARWIVALAGYTGQPGDTPPADDSSEEERAAALQAASPALRRTAHDAIGYLLDGDIAQVEEVENRLKAQYGDQMPAVVLQAVVIVATGVKDHREAQAA